MRVLRRSVFLMIAALVAAVCLRAEPLSLEEAIHQALARNPTLKVEEYNPRIARANVLAAYGSFDPALTFNGEYLRTANFSSINDATGPALLFKSISSQHSVSLDGLLPTGASYSVGAVQNTSGEFGQLGGSYSTFQGITVTQPILRDLFYNTPNATLKIAKVDRTISDLDYRESVSDIITNVVVLYNNLALAEANLVITRKSRDLAANFYHENQRRAAAGSIAVSDVVEAQEQVASHEEGILIAERSVADASNGLRQLVGQSALNQEILQVNETVVPEDTSIDVAADIKTALAHRPDYQAVRLGIKRTGIQLSLARNQVLPRLDFIGAFGYGNFPGFPLKDENNTAWSAGLAVSVPITFAAGRGHARAARLVHEQAQATVAQMEGQITLDVANGAGQIQTTQKRVAAARVAYELSQRALAAEEKKFRAGSTSTFQVTQFQNELFTVEADLAFALTDQRNASANYDRILGRVLERRNVTLKP